MGILIEAFSLVLSFSHDFKKPEWVIPVILPIIYQNDVDDEIWDIDLILIACNVKLDSGMNKTFWDVEI